jgi:hypothetical protein
MEECHSATTNTNREHGTQPTDPSFRQFTRPLSGTGASSSATTAAKKKPLAGRGEFLAKLCKHRNKDLLTSSYNYYNYNYFEVLTNYTTYQFVTPTDEEINMNSCVVVSTK